MSDEKGEEVVDVMLEVFKSQFLNTMKERGFIHQCTNFNSLDDKFSTEVVKAYLGFDATAKSLHVGSLLQIMILRTLQKCGHKPIILVGGGTTKVGDPSGKDESRQLLTEEVIGDNISSLSKVFRKFIKFGDGPTDAVMVNNADWLDKINYLEVYSYTLILLNPHILYTLNTLNTLYTLYTLYFYTVIVPEGLWQVLHHQPDALFRVGEAAPCA
jgi:hypothetical protein